MAYYYIGWQALLLLLAFLVTMALLPVTVHKLPLEKPAITPRRKPHWNDGFSFFLQKGKLRHLMLLSTFYAGIIGLLSMFKPFMVDQGFTVKEIGVISGIFGTAIGALSSLLAGFYIRRIPRSSSLLIIALMGLLSTLFFVWKMHGQVPLWAIFAASTLVWGTYGMASVFIYTVAMDKVRPGLEGTDFTIQIVITHLSSLILTIVLSKVANMFGYHRMFMIETLIALGILILSTTLYKKVVTR
jgi:hypothetical protein